MTNEYQIKLEIFEGPLDLLLYLVEKDEVDICNIQVSRVCAQFLEYLELIKELDIELAGEYLVMASTLTRLKARELLPHDEAPPEAEEGEIVSREQLIEQLLQYKRFKEASRHLRGMENEQRGTHYKAMPEKVEWADEFEDTGVEVSTFELLSALKKVLEQTSKDPSHQVAREDIRLDDRIEYIISFLYDHPKVEFAQLFEGMRSRMAVVVTFMALLELMKMEMIRVTQEAHFGPIHIQRRDSEAESEAPLQDTDDSVSAEAVESESEDEIADPVSEPAPDEGVQAAGALDTELQTDAGSDELVTPETDQEQPSHDRTPHMEDTEAEPAQNQALDENQAEETQTLE